MGLYDKVQHIRTQISREEAKLDALKANKESAGTLGQEKAVLLEIERKKAYIKGLKDALKILNT